MKETSISFSAKNSLVLHPYLHRENFNATVVNFDSKMKTLIVFAVIFVVCGAVSEGVNEGSPETKSDSSTANVKDQ